jgi:hypothetical protein
MEESVYRARAFPFTNTVNSEQNGKSGNLKSNLAFLKNKTSVISL